MANTGATLLSGAAPSDSLTANFAVGDTITVNGTVVTFVASGAVGNQLNITDSIATLLTKIDSITGTAIPSSIIRRRHHAAFRHGLRSLGHQFELQRICSTRLHRHRDRAAHRRRHRRHRPGGRQRQLDLPRQSIAGGAVTTYDVSGAPVNLQFRWAKVDSSSLGAGHTDTWNMFYQVNPNATGTNVAWQNVNTNFTFSPQRPDDAGDRLASRSPTPPSTACRSAAR